MLGKSIVLRGVLGAEQTIVDGEGARRCLVSLTGQAAATEVEGFTFLAGAAESGAGLWIVNTSLTFRQCVIRGCEATASGGGVLSSTNGCNPAASNTSFCHNLPTHIDGWSWQDLGGNCFVDTCVDVNGDGLPDDCQCLPDFNGDEQVAIDDMLQLLAAWECVDCPIEDLNGDGIVDIDDLLSIMASWGACG